MKDILTIGASSITLTLGAFIENSLQEISVWMLVMAIVIISDLFAGCYKVWSRGEKLRVSKGMRDTMGKLLVYFAFVVASVFVGNASGITGLAKWCCMAVITGEGMSIISNILKAHGYDLNIGTIIKLLQKKVSLETDEAIIKKEKKQKK